MPMEQKRDILCDTGTVEVRCEYCGARYLVAHDEMTDKETGGV
jgi:redox-regulated HSP33 family molecular chaperone